MTGKEFAIELRRRLQGHCTHTSDADPVVAAFFEEVTQELQEKAWMYEELCD